jgi:hypothetical protein
LITSLAFANAQNYKAPKIDATGKVTVAGMQIGSINKEGNILDAKGNKVATIDNEGELVDINTGKKLGKASKNGAFTKYYSDGKTEVHTFSEPDKDGFCELKDKSGKVIGVVHENYKQQGACAIHCLSKKK